MRRGQCRKADQPVPYSCKYGTGYPYKDAGYIKEFIPEAHVNHGTMTLHGANPIVDVSFPEKGNKKVIKYLLEQKCIQYRRGTNTKGTRIRNLGIIFSEDGKTLYTGKW